MNRREARPRNSGFTLVELLATLLISGIVLGGIYSVFVSQQRAFAAQEQISEMSQNIRTAMDLMTREIRLAGYRTSGATFNGIFTAQASTIRILADLNQDGDTIDNNEDITYSYDAATLQIWRNSTSSPVADNITSVNFLYTLSDGSTSSTPSNPADIRMVNISITARTSYPDPGTGQYRSITLTSDVTPPNLAF